MKTRTINVERSTATAHRLSHYEGVCGNLHGHNIQWKVHMSISMEGVGEDNMPVDFKEISDVIDSVDHAILLKKDDPLIEQLEIFEDRSDRSDGAYHITENEALGEAWVFPGEDPTCEYMVEWMAERIYNIHDNIQEVKVEAAETDKYNMEGWYFGTENK